MDTTTEPTIRKRGRFVLEHRTTDGLTNVVSEHSTFSAAEAYRLEIGTKGRHNDFIIVDRSKNLVAEAADDNELEDLDRQIALEKKKADLNALREANRKAEMESKGETKVG